MKEGYAIIINDGNTCYCKTMQQKMQTFSYTNLKKTKIFPRFNNIKRNGQSSIADIQAAVYQKK